MAEDLRTTLQGELDRAGVDARAVVIPTPWDVGPVNAYLFPGDPVTFVDAGIDSPEARTILAEALAAEDLSASDVKRVIVTHAHSDHFGGAGWLQEQSGCEVLVHPFDIEMTSREADWRTLLRELFLPLGFSEEILERNFTGDREMTTPAFGPLDDGDAFDVGGGRLVIEHHPGHTPGHVWVVHEPTGAIFVGDFVIGDHPTNAGLEIDTSHPTGRAPLLQQYNAGLRELMRRDVPALFPGHGPAITDHRALIARRLAKTDRRTRHVAEALSATPRSPLELGRTLYRSRAEESWEVMADLVGRLDLLVAQGRAGVRMGEDGVWYFTSKDL